jgi:hypothetical protein
VRPRRNPRALPDFRHVRTKAAYGMTGAR